MKRKSPCNKRTVEDRFWAKVNKAGDCWLWNGAIGSNGYGRFAMYPGPARQAHRQAWEITNGVIPDGLLVCHKCDNRACVNPDHLFLGTAKENTADMLAKKRHSHGERHAEKVRASESRYHKLTHDDVRGIRAGLRNGGKQREVARTFGVSQRTVAMILHRLTWAHVND